MTHHLHPESDNAPMTLKAWTELVITELKTAGYEAESYRGFPLVKRPTDWDAGIKLINLTLSVPVRKEIWAEGMLFVPAGSPRCT